MAEKKYEWQVVFTSSAEKQVKELLKKHPAVYENFSALVREIQQAGPYRINWPHFCTIGKRKGIPQDSYHCHIKRGRPTYVVCWYIEDKKIKIVEIYYVGTHEKAPY